MVAALVLPILLERLLPRRALALNHEEHPQFDPPDGLLDHVARARVHVSAAAEAGAMRRLGFLAASLPPVVATPFFDGGSLAPQCAGLPESRRLRHAASLSIISTMARMVSRGVTFVSRSP